MNDEGTRIDWAHATVRSAPMLMLGEPARVKVVVASVMQPTVAYRYPPNASL
jgi:hypothetical protein